MERSMPRGIHHEDKETEDDGSVRGKHLKLFMQPLLHFHLHFQSFSNLEPPETSRERLIK